VRHRRPRLSRRGAARAVPWPWLGAALLVLCADACSQQVALTTTFCLLVFLLLGTPWLFLVVR